MNKPHLIQKGKFKAEVSADRSGAKISISGQVNEDADFSQVLRWVAPQKQIAIDVSNVVAINSIGVRSWSLFITELQAKHPCVFSGVSEAFAEQAAVISTMLGKPGTPVLAFNAPYFCSSCSTRVSIPIKLESLPVKDGRAFFPKPACPRCGKPYEFDAIEEEYQQLLKHAGRR